MNPKVSQISICLVSLLALSGVLVLPEVACAALVEYWDFNNRNHIGYNPITTGSLTRAGEAQYTSGGRFGGGLLLDGSGDYLYHDPLTSAPTGIPTGNSSYTISAWIKPASGTVRRGIVGWGAYGTARNVNALRLGDQSNALTHYWWSADMNNVSASPVNLYDGWHHVAVTYDGTTRSLYVDGALKTSDTPGTNDAQAQNFAIGATNFWKFPANLEYFKGTLDDIAIYNHALAATEIQTLAAGQSPLSSVSLPTPVDHFVADSLNTLGNGRVLANGDWKGQGTNTNAKANVAGGNATLRTGTIGGHAVVNFDGDDYLQIINGAMTLSSDHARDNFTVVAVYRTNQGVSDTTVNWYTNTSIVDSEQADVVNDWGLNITSNGQLAAGLGKPDITQYSSSSSYFQDGLAHVAVYTRSGGTISLYVDGALVGTRADGSTAARNAVDYFFGGNHTGGKKLIGDLAEARIYNVALNSTQVAALASQLMGTYAPKLYHGTVLNTPGLAAYYRLGEGTTTDALAYNEIGPNTTHGTYDATPSRHPTVNQPGAFTVHDSNTAFYFDATQQQYVQVPNFLVSSQSADFSLELLVKSTAANILTGTAAYSGNGVVWSDVPGVADDFVLAVLNGHLAFFDGDAANGAGSNIEGTTLINDVQWHHVVVTRDGGGQMQIWLDGRVEASGLAGSAVLDDNSSIYIGGNYRDNRYFTGWIDDVAFYNRVLSPAEILQHYQAAAVPEPASGVLAAMGLGLLGLLAARKRKGG